MFKTYSQSEFVSHNPDGSDAALALARTEARFKKLAEIASDWFWETDANHVYTWFSANVEKHTGIDVEWHLGRSRIALISTATDEASVAEHIALLNRHEPFRDIEFCREGPDGLTWVRSSGVPIFDNDGTFKGYLGTGRNITALKLAEERIRNLAMNDPLTGIANRATFEAALEQACADAARGKVQIALAMIDLDRFKQVNDHCGHDGGDALLIRTAGYLRSVCRHDRDLPARIGGDEFALLLESEPGSPPPLTRLRELASELRKPAQIGDFQVNAGASIGLAIGPRDGQTADTLMKAADLAVYAAKTRGRGKLIEFEPALAERAFELAALEADLRGAMERDEFSLAFMPIVELTDGKTQCYEALLRWNHPKRGWLHPVAFLDSAKKVGMLTPITNVVCDRMMHLAKTALADKNVQPGVRVSMNLGFERTWPNGTLEALSAEILDTPELAKRLTIDLIERDLVDMELRRVRHWLDKLVHAGVELMLDGFGTGLGSLNNLRQLPVSAVKLDRDLIRDIDTDPKRQAIMMGVMDLARRLNIKVIAKHVEKQAQADWLKAHGCHAAQGFLFGQPLDLAQLERRLQRDASTSAKPEPDSRQLDLLEGSHW